jgi:hypothetical protein
VRQINFHRPWINLFQFHEKRVILRISLALGEGTMIMLLAASSLYLTALQAGTAAPTTAFRSCLHEAAAKAKTEKIAADAIETYLKNACSSQMASLREALVAARMKNGMSHSAAVSDSALTLNDYILTPVENYKFTANMDAKQVAAAPAPAPAPAAKAVMTPAAASASPATQPPKP